MEASKREYIEKLKRELDSIEEKWMCINNENIMVGEDYRSAACEMRNLLAGLQATIEERELTIAERDETIAQFRERL